MIPFLRSEGTCAYFSNPGTSQQNGHAKHKLRHILDTTRALLVSTSILKEFWRDTILTIIYIINCIPSPVIHNQFPYECFYGFRLDYLFSNFWLCLFLFYSNLMNMPSLSLALVFVVFQGRGLNIKDIGAMIQYQNILGFYIM